MSCHTQERVNAMPPGMALLQSLQTIPQIHKLSLKPWGDPCRGGMLRQRGMDKTGQDCTEKDISFIQANQHPF